DSDFSDVTQFVNTMSMIIYSLVFVLGVLGNGVVIWVTGFKMKKTVNTVWFLNLAVADFLFTAFLPLSVTYIAMDSHWPFGKFMCKLNAMILYLNMFASVYLLVVISVDRCVSVVLPIWAQNHRSVRKASCVSLAVWVLALIFSVPYFIFKDTAPSSNNRTITCVYNYALPNDNKNPSVNQLRRMRLQVMTIGRFLLRFVVPFTIIIFCYAAIILRLRKKHPLPSQSSRPFRIIAAVIITFFLCWAPYHIQDLVEMMMFHTTDFFSPSLHKRFNIPHQITSSLAFINSCLNPLLYVFIGQNYKAEIRKSFLKVMERAFVESST
ncbi:unnamed protein product, partial [Tetraodon nigroviridis]